MNGKWIRGGCIAAALLMAAILFFGANEIGKLNTVPHLVHKVEHFFYYGIMAFLLARGFGPRWWWTALLAVPLIGALDEWHQLYVPGRNSSVYDWMTDVIGTLFFTYVYFRFAKYGTPAAPGDVRDAAKGEGKGRTARGEGE